MDSGPARWARPGMAARVVPRRGWAAGPEPMNTACAGSAPHVLDDVDQFADRGHRFVEGRPFLAVERNLDHPFDPAGADHDRDADVELLDAVLAIEPCGAGQHAFLVSEIGFGHLDRRAGWRIEG